MHTARPELAQVLRKEKRLRSLHRVLTWGGSSAGFLWILFWLPFGLIFSVLLTLAVLFTPYLLYSLAKLGRNGWILTFALVVLVPIGAAAVGTVEPVNLLPGPGRTTLPKTVTGYLLFIFPLLTFYGYTFLLRNSVAEWLEEVRWRREDLERRSRPPEGSSGDTPGHSPSDSPGVAPGAESTRPSKN